MQEKNLALSKKAEDIILERVKHRLIDLVRKTDNYESFSKIARGKFNFFYENLVKTALDLGAEKGRVLDMGTHFGLCGINLAKQDYPFDITSFQDSVKAVEISKKFSEEDMQDKIKWRIGKPESLPFRAKTFDLVISGFDMHHWENPVRVFNEIERVMKNNAVLLIADFRREAFSLMMPLLKTYSLAAKNDEFYEEMKSSFNSSYNKSELVELLKNSDLEDWKISKDVQFVYIFKSKEKRKHVVVKFTPE